MSKSTPKKSNGSHSRFPGQRNGGILAARRAKRRKEAEERQARRNERTPEEQLALLDARGVAARRERARLELEARA